MSKPNVPVVEPFDAVSFSNGLKDHVIRHCFDPGENWQVFFSNRKLDAALFGFEYNGKSDDDFLALCQEYEKLASDILLKLCTEFLWHFHFLESRPYGRGKLTYQTIQAIDVRKQIKVIAESFVRNGECQPYIIVTAFRFWCRNSSGQNKLRKFVDKIRREREFIRNNPDVPAQTIVIADHWGEEEMIQCQH